MTAINQQQVDDSDTIDLSEIFRTILNHWKLVVICVFVALFVAILYLRETRSIYSVDGLIQIESPQGASDNLLGGLGLSNLGDIKSPSDTEIQLLRSRFVLGEAIRSLNLDIMLSSDHDQWYRRFFHSVPYKTSYAKDGVTYSSGKGSFKIIKFKVPDVFLGQIFELKFTENGRYTLTSANQLNNLPVLNGNLGQVLTVPVGGEVLQLLIQANTKNIAPHSIYLSKRSLLNSVGEINKNLSVTEKGKQTGILSLLYQGSDQDYIVQTLNEIMQVYLAQNVASRTRETQRTLSFLDQQLPLLRKELESSEDKYNTFREKNNTIDPTKEAELLLQQSVELRTKKLELEQQGVLLGQKYTSNFPLISQIKAQVAALDQNGKDLENRVTAMPELQRQYLQLYRDVQVNTVIYTNLLNSYEQLKVLKAGKTATVRILDQAIKSSSPIKPQKILVLLLSVVLGLIASGILIFLKSIFYSGVKDLDQIEARTGLSVVATIPRSKYQEKIFSKRLKRNGLIAEIDSEDLAVESLRSLRTAMHFSVEKSHNNIILITGPSPEIGKSFVSANFAAVYAQMGKTVVVVDADMRRGHLHQYFNAKQNYGLSEYLRDDHLAVSDVCHSTAVEGLSFIGRGSSPSNPAELLLSKRFSLLMNELSAQYDYVLVDSPPVLAATDAVIISCLAGVTLLIARYGQTNMRELELSISRLSQAEASIQGIIFNDVQMGIGYGYQYAYHYRADK